MDEDVPDGLSVGAEAGEQRHRQDGGHRRHLIRKTRIGLNFRAVEVAHVEILRAIMLQVPGSTPPPRPQVSK